MMNNIKKVILDTDLGADCDDAVALALFCNYEKQKKCVIDSLTLSTSRDNSHKALKAILNYYNMHDLPVGKMPKPGLKCDKFDYYNNELAIGIDDFNVYDASSLILDRLKNSKEKITLVCVGPLTNIAKTFKKDPILFKSKVETIYIMGCVFNEEKREWNTLQDVKAAKVIYEECDVKKIICPGELGNKIVCGETTFNDTNSPVAKSISLFNENACSDKNNKSRYSWDPITVYVAINDEFIIYSEKGRIKVSDKGITTFVKDPNGECVIASINDTNINKIKKHINNNIMKEGNQIMEKEKQTSKKVLELEKRNNSKITSLLFPSDVDKSEKQGYIVLKDINKIYDNDVQAVFDFNLNIQKNEFIVFVGPSGCGKSTTLRMIAGLEEISAGDLFINNRYSNDLAPKDRDIAMVFQSYALYPHMSVKDNLAFGLKIRKTLLPVKDKEGKDIYWIDANKLKALNKQVKDCNYVIKLSERKINNFNTQLNKETDKDKKFVINEQISYYKNQIELAKKNITELNGQIKVAETTKVQKFTMQHLPKAVINEKVKNAAKILEIEQYLNRKPKELSGGQRQRVALGRAIVRDSSAFLMDEPLSNLDAKLRVQMRSEIVSIHKQIGATTIYVTHDQTEAMTMADRIVVMKDGLVQQIGKPRTIYNYPKNLFVAQFIGAPAMNVIECNYSKGGITIGDNIKIKLEKDVTKKINSYYDGEISRLNKLIEDLDVLLRNVDHPRHEIHIKAKEQALQLIEYYKGNINSSFRAMFGIRPEDIEVSLKEKPNSIKLTVNLVELLGSEYYLHTKLGDKKFVIKSPANIDVENGMNIYVTLNISKSHLFDVRTEQAIY